MSLAPVALFVYNRADHFEKTVTALSECDLADQTDLYIFSDGPKNGSAAPAVEAVRKLAGKVTESGDFKSVTLRNSEENKGLAASVISGVTEVVSEYGKVIVLEDDCVASPFLLAYMNECLDRFESDKRIGSIAGFAPDIALPEDYTADIYTAYRSCSCTWATWRDRFEDVDWELNDADMLFRDRDMLKRFNSNGSDRLIRLYRQMKGGKDSWSIRFGWHLVKNNMLTVYPRFSYIKNIGADDTGVHSAGSDAAILEVDLSKAISAPTIEYIAPDKRIQRSMKRFYSGGFVSDIKRAIATKAIIIKERAKK